MSTPDENSASNVASDPHPPTYFNASESVQEASSSGLPFLVTHWLANYAGSQSNGDESQSDAIRRVHDAATELASAFSTLGAFGSSGVKQRSDPSLLAPPMRLGVRNATYSDMTRSWSNVPPQQLELLAESAASTSLATRDAANRLAPTQDLVQAAYEASYRTSESGGRRLRDGNGEYDEAVPPTAVSILEPPPLLALSTAPRTDTDRTTTIVKDSYRELPVAVASDFARIDAMVSTSTRRARDEKEQKRARQAELEEVENAIQRQTSMKSSLTRHLREQCDALANLQATSTPAELESSTMLQTSRIEEARNRLQTCERVIDQLGHKRAALANLILKARAETNSSCAMEKKKKLAASLKRYGDPFPSETFVSSLATQSHNLAFTATRQYGLCGALQRCGRRPGAFPKRSPVSAARRASMSYRMSHGITVNAHLSFPVFCVRFDRTGRYFVTGSDDSLVKLFCLSVGKSKAIGKKSDGSRDLKFCFGANERSAVLVCTLRGHAGVICDIAVSADNSFLATASGDGDCRIWGLKDGCPIAILRGHVGGANMVSWSSLTPFRLVTAGDDGFCRMWDIREAALKRYGAFIGRRKEYTLQLHDSCLETVEEASYPLGSSDGAVEQSVILPPLPSREGELVEEIAPPPLPPAGEPNGNANGVNDEPEENVGLGIVNNESEPGAFVANDVLDEGVKLLAKMQHGDLSAEQHAGPGTRARRKSVRVICLARCPLGGHIVTGSDDGVCRVWLDADDARVERADGRSAGSLSESERRRSTRSGFFSPQGRKLADLTGHMNPITDLHYSHTGDRILSASQKDGVARVWSWISDGSDPLSFSDLRQIVLRLPRPISGSRREAHVANESGTSVACDVAVWTADDSKIVTSQCCPLKATSTDIVPGSQYILVWDSQTGHCLLGISDAHTAQCQVVVPHPIEASVFCSAGSDGVAKLWDMEKGTCLLRHENTSEFGATADRGDRGQPSGYLEGAFSPDSLSLILSDDKGQFTVLSELAARERAEGQNLSQLTPRDTWLNEQYFASDYYDLLYDANGYCVEKGSRRPPHLAPRAARCSHSGSAWAGDIDETFETLEGPMPLGENTCRSSRVSIRLAKEYTRNGGRQLSCTGEPRISRIGEFDPKRTFLFSGSGGEIRGFLSQTEHTETAHQAPRQISRNRATSARTLSNNFNWIGYDEAREEDGLEVEDSDEDFSPRLRTFASHDEQSDSDLELSDSSSVRVDSARSRRRRRRDQERERVISSEVQATRVSQRQSERQRSHYAIPDSDEDFDEYEPVISTNNTPSGPHVEDYNEGMHFFRLPDGARVHREWLRRTESVNSYCGRKTYSPQVGDSVVYIPQAHRETLECFPILEAPWTDWPSSLKCPVIRCSVNEIRYRFPLKSCFSSREKRTQCRSVVAILTLSITGIPETSNDRGLPWPTPRFHAIAARTRAAPKTFEVHMFESQCADFLFPEKLFIWRLETLEQAAPSQQRSFFDGVRVVNFSPDDDNGNRREDADFTPYHGRIRRVKRGNVPNDRFGGSGLDSLRVEWDDPDWGITSSSPWEISLIEVGYDFEPPRLADHEKQAVENSLELMRQNASVREWFYHPVNGTTFSDYNNRIEVPMYFSLIEERFKADYYSNPRSVLADAQLIRDNCVKYNGLQAELSEAAGEMVESFEAHLNTELERLSPTEDTGLSEQRDNMDRSDRRSSSRHSRGSQSSSLELLPEPSGMEARQSAQPWQRATRSGRASRRITSSLVHAGRLRSDVHSLQDSSGREEESPPGSRNEQSDDGSFDPAAASRQRAPRTFESRSRHFAQTRGDEEEEASYNSDYESEDDFEQTPPLRSTIPSDPNPSSRPRRAAASRQSPRFGRRRTYSSDDNGDEVDYASSGLSEDETEKRRETLRSSLHLPRKRENSEIDEPAESPSQRRSLREKPRHSMADLSNSEVEDDTSSEEERNEGDSRKRRSSGRRGRRSKASKKSRTVETRSQDEAISVVLEPWPEIQLRRISDVGAAVMNAMSALDINGTFSAPVQELCPEIAAAYKKAIAIPMDFRSIREDRMPVYEHIKDLQDDLLLCFDNCIQFNEPSSPFALEAMTYRAQVNDVFRNACESCKVRLRGWKG